MDDLKRLGGSAVDFFGPRPSIVILRIKQGIVEISIRAAIIVLAFLIFIAGAVLNTHVKIGPFNFPDLNSALHATRTGAEWIIVVCLVSMLWQSLAILLRFLNLTLVEKYIGLVLIVEIVVRGLFIISWFSAAIFFSVQSSSTWRKRYETTLKNVSFSTISSSAAATSSFSFFILAAEIFLVVWVLMWLILRWQQLVTQQLRYSRGPTDRDTDDLAPGEDD